MISLKSQLARLPRFLAICLLAAICTVAIAYVFFKTSSVRVVNQSTVPISDIRVELGGKEFWTGSLAPGESHMSFGSVNRDGYIVIAFRKDSVAYKRVFTHVTTYFPGHHQLTITPVLKVECSSTDAECADLTERWALPAN